MAKSNFISVQFFDSHLLLSFVFIYYSMYSWFNENNVAKKVIKMTSTSIIGTIIGRKIQKSNIIVPQKSRK